MNIIFFSSDDFAAETLQFLTKGMAEEYGFNVNVKGVVTSNGKAKYYPESIKQIAFDNDIPYCIPKNEEDLYNFLTSFNDIDVYVVISYKKLSQRILNIVNGKAINVHASVLPFLKGAAPINWAIRNGFKETGLTSFYLNNDIDCGNVIDSTIIKVDDNETFETLYKKLSDRCTTFLMETLSKMMLKEYDVGKKQICLGIEDKYPKLFKAPKITNKYWGDWLRFSQKEIGCLFRSTNEGLPIKLYAVNRDDNRDYYEFDAKIWDFEFVSNFEEGSNNINLDFTQCDGKNYIRVVFGTQIEKAISLKEIQLSGKKRLSIIEFLRGFKYSRLISQYKLMISTAEYGNNG